MTTLIYIGIFAYIIFGFGWVMQILMKSDPFAETTRPIWAACIWAFGLALQCLWVMNGLPGIRK